VLLDRFAGARRFAGAEVRGVVFRALGVALRDFEDVLALLVLRGLFEAPLATLERG
jgi:hypothetical protein